MKNLLISIMAKLGFVPIAKYELMGTIFLGEIDKLNQIITDNAPIIDDYDYNATTVNLVGDDELIIDFDDDYNYCPECDVAGVLDESNGDILCPHCGQLLSTLANNDENARQEEYDYQAFLARKDDTFNTFPHNDTDACPF